MKKRKIKRDVKPISAVLYWLQVIVLSPILIPILLLGIVCEYVANLWNSYKDWFLSKFRVL